MKINELLELLKFAWRKGEIYGLYGLSHDFSNIKDSDSYGLDSNWEMTSKEINKKLLCEGLTLYELRGNFIDYLTKKYKCTKKECQEAWIKAQKHFPSYNPLVKDRLTLEVAVRDIIDGTFRPDITEVENIE